MEVWITGFSFDLNALDYFVEPEMTNNPPTSQNVSVDGVEDQSVVVTLNGDDGDAEVEQPLTYQIVSGPQFGENLRV